jgi:4-amino-4-deoxy-L-arabinose transferase-like glycosyltransferase
VNLVTVAAWRRRQEACSEAPPLPDDDQKRANGFQARTGAATIDSPDTNAGDFVRSQQAGLAAAISLAKPAPSGRPLPMVKSPAPPPEPPASPRGEAASAGPAQPVPVIVLPTPVIDRFSVSVRSAPATPDSLPAGSAQASRERRAAWNSHSFAQIRGLPLAAILTAQAVLSLRLVWSNMAFNDEALYLWAGHMEWVHWLHGAPIPAFATYFSGSPVIYPPLGALVESIGGLAGARILSLCFMLGTTGLLYATATRLFNRKTAWFACGLFATVGPTADLGAFATYDAMAIFLLALSSWMAVRAQGRFSELWLGLSALVMILADATKYASALWNPVIIALAVLATDLASKDAVARGIRYISYALCVAVPSLLLAGGRTYIRGIMSTTLARAADHYSPQTALWTGATYIGIIVALAVIGARLNWQTSLSHRLLGVVLTIALVLAPLEEARIHTIASLYKHVVFGGLFGTIIAGYALARATEVNKAKGWRAGVAAVVFCGLVGFGQASDMFGYWPSSPSMIHTVSRVVVGTPGAVLTDEWNVIRYYLYKSGYPVDRINVYSFSDPVISMYTDPTGLFRNYALAIHGNRFEVAEIDLTSGKMSQGDKIILTALRSARGYRLSARIPWSDAYNHGWFEIWTRIR